MSTGVFFGLLPALRASRPDPWSTLKDTVGSIAGAGGSLFLRKGLVTAQVALSFLLLFGAGLFVRSLQNLQATDTGVKLNNLITFQLAPALSGYDDQRAGVSAIWYPQPFGVQAEWNWGTTPGLGIVNNTIEDTDLQGG